MSCSRLFPSMARRPLPSPFRPAAAALAVTALMVLSASIACAERNEFPFEANTISVSAEGGLEHFGGRLESGYVQAWDLAARVSWEPFAPFHPAFLDHAFDGAFTIGLEPIFQRFNTRGRNFGGLGLQGQYYFLRWRIGPLVPWFDVMAAPGGTDLHLSHPNLEGPFMFVIHYGVGLSYFMDPRHTFYFGLQAQHVSNALTYGKDYSLNTPAGVVFGVSWFFPR